jgi:hypothetical protein
MSDDDKNDSPSSSRSLHSSASMDDSFRRRSSNCSDSSSDRSDPGKSGLAPTIGHPLKPLEEYVKAATEGFVYPGKQRAGSKASLDKINLKVIKPDSDVRYRRRLERNGKILIREARLRQKNAREVLRTSGNDTMGLESSSEEEVDEDDRIHPGSSQIDWHELGRSTWWANDPIFNAMPVSAISSAVGWAHHQTHDWEDRSVPVEIGMKPLLDLPNNPMPPSHLEWIVQRATKKTMTQLVTWKKQTFSTLPDHESKPANTRQPASKVKRLDWQTWTYDSQDETYQLVKKSFTPRETVSVTVPFARNRITEQCMSESFDTSAKVSMGIAIEEMVTASLLPLARDHVKRCRLLGEKDSFDEWTLPPEEAILKLNAGHAYMGSAQEPSVAGFDEWCKSRDLDPEFVEKNKDLYGRVHPLAHQREKSTREK